jgi:hypothetical protein
MPANASARVLKGLLALLIAFGLLTACGGPEPTAQVIVVTSTFTPAPAVLVVTATFTASPEATETPLPTDTATPEPSATPPPEDTATPTPEPVTYVTYKHPSGAFSLDIPQDGDYSEDDTGVYLTYNDSLLMVFYTNPDTLLGAADLEAAVPAILDESLVGQGLISSYDGLETQTNDAGDMIGAKFTIASDTFGDGDGAMILWQLEHTLYFMILLTPDYASVEQVWQTAFNTLTATSIEPTATTVPPTNTAVPPTPTRKPTPKPTKAPAPTSPPPASNQGCYLFENQIDAELTVTFTAQDRQWSDSFKVPANGTKQYCLDPGHYTYTIDAPPPWNSINGDLQVNPGDRYRWPIRGG